MHGRAERIAAGAGIIAGAERIAASAPDLAARLASFVARERLPGAAAGVVCGDELAWLGGTGFADLASGTATDPAMSYGIASITKTFTGTAIMRLRDAGRLGLDDPAVAWLPELGALVSPAYRGSEPLISRGFRSALAAGGFRKCCRREA